MGMETTARIMGTPVEYAWVQLYAMWKSREGTTEPVRQVSHPIKSPKAEAYMIPKGVICEMPKIRAEITMAAAGGISFLRVPRHWNRSPVSMFF